MSNTKRNIDAVGRRRGELKTIKGKVHHWVPGKGWVARTPQEQANIDANQKKNKTNPDFTTPPKTEDKKDNGDDKKVVTKKDDKKVVINKKSNKKNVCISKKDAEKKRWLKKTSKSPAAKAGFSDEERWAAQQKHREWKAARKAGTLADWEEKYHPGRGRYKNKKKAKIEKPKTEPKKNKLTIKEQHKSKLDQQQNETAKIMQNDSRYLGPKYKKKKNGGK